MKNTFATSHLSSPLKEGSRLRPHRSKGKKSINVGLMLTSLVDAFTLMVIYLIMNSSDVEQFDLKEGVMIPTAAHSEKLDSSPVVLFKDNGFYIDDQLVANNQLKAALEKLKIKSESLFKGGDSAIVVQADEKVGFEKLQPLLVASSYAGIKQVKFAVLVEE